MVTRQSFAACCGMWQVTWEHFSAVDYVCAKLASPLGIGVCVSVLQCVASILR